MPVEVVRKTRSGCNGMGYVRILDAEENVRASDEQTLSLERKRMT